MKLFDLGRRNINTVLESGDWEDSATLRELIDETVSSGKYSAKGFVELLQRSHMETNLRKRTERVKAVEEILINTHNSGICDALLDVFKSVIDSEVRHAIIRIVSAVGDGKLAKSLVSMLRDKDREVRAAAAVMFKAVGAVANFELVRNASLEMSGWDSKREVIDVLYHLDKERTIPVLAEIVKSPNRADVRAAIEKLAMINTVSSRRLLIEVTHHESSRFRLWATEALAEIGDPELRHVFETLTEDGTSNVVLAALAGLEKLKSHEAINRVVELIDHKDPLVSAKAIGVLKILGDNSAVKPLIRKLREKDLTIRQTTMDALVVLGKANSIDTCKMLIEIMLDQDVNVRRCSIDIIANLGAHGVIWELFQYIKDEDWWVREQVATTFCDLQDHRIIEPVIALLKEQSSKIRRYAIEILNSLPDTKSIPALLSALYDSDWWIRERAIEAIGHIKDHSVVPHLLGLLSAKDFNWVTIRALAEIAHPSAFDSLVKLLRDDREEIRTEALLAIAGLGMVKEAEAAITKLLSDPVKAIRMKVRELLGSIVSDIDSKVAEGEREYQQKYLSKLDYYLLEIKKNKASDLFISPFRPPLMKKHGDVLPLSEEVMSPEETKTLLLDICPPDVQGKFMEMKDADFSYDIPGEGRFRVNLCVQRVGISGAFRVIPDKPPTLDELKVPPILKHFTRLSQGLVLVTGSIGSGKSTTLAAIVNEINEVRDDHIITIEDPIEYVHQHKNCIVNQRELGGDTLSFSAALRSALREDPDVILVGELRDLETISMAITSAETGHLVFGTLHTNNAAKTVDRIIDVFPASQAGQIRTMLSESLIGVVSQQLVKCIGGGITAAMEILIGTPALSSMIREGKTFQIPTIMITGQKQGMQSMDQALMKLYKDNVISIEEAYNKSASKKEFEEYLRAEQATKQTAAPKVETAAVGGN